MIWIIGIKSLCYLGFNLCRIGFLKSSKIKLTLTCPFKVMPLKRVIVKDKLTLLYKSVFFLMMKLHYSMVFSTFWTQNKQDREEGFDFFVSLFLSVKQKNSTLDLSESLNITCEMFRSWTIQASAKQGNVRGIVVKAFV